MTHVVLHFAWILICLQLGIYVDAKFLETKVDGAPTFQHDTEFIDLFVKI